MNMRNVRSRIRVRITLASWIALISTALAGAANAQTAEAEHPNDAPQAGKDVQAYDDFDGKLAIEWAPVRPDPTHVSLDKHPGNLTITTQRGSIHANQDTDPLTLGARAKNLYLIPTPASDSGDFVMTTRVVSFAPTTSWQQAGLMVYDDDDNYLKCDLEWSRGAPSDIRPVYLRETDAKSHVVSATPNKKCNTFWLRVTKRGALYEYTYSTDGEDYALVQEKPWGDGTPKSIGIFAKNGGNPLAGDIDAQFDFFEVRSLTDAEKNQPAYLQRKKLQGDWKVVALERSGKPVDDVALSQFAFDAGQVIVTEGAKTLKTEYTLDVSAEPKQLVLAGLFNQRSGPVRAVYSLEGDTLTLCLDPRPGAAPPADLTTEQGDGRLLLTLRRVKDTD
jgi:uncharacterized protein (TIGR03067 family)